MRSSAYLLVLGVVLIGLVILIASAVTDAMSTLSTIP